MTEQHLSTPSDAHDRTKHTVQLHMTLIEALVGAKRAQQLPLDLRVMGVLHSLPDDERAAIEGFTARCLAIRAADTLTVEDVAKHFTISARQVQRLAQAGALNGTKIGRRWVFNEKQLERFVLAHAYVSGGRVRPDSPWVSQADTHLVEQARAQLGEGDWRIRQLAQALHTTQDEAYLLVLGWHAAYLVNHTGRRGAWRFAPTP